MSRLPKTPSRACGALAGLLSAVWCGAAPVAADVVYFTSGRSKTGIVLEESDAVIRFQSQDGVIGIPWTVIDSVERGTKAENRAIRSTWAEAQREAERVRRKRRQEREAARAATAPDPGVAQADAGRAEEMHRRQLERERARVTKFRREQEDLAEEDRTTDPLVIGPVHMEKTPSTVEVRADVLNVSGQAYHGIAVEVALVEGVGTDRERVAMRQQLAIPELLADRIAPLVVTFGVVPDYPVTPRMRITSSTAAP